MEDDEFEKIQKKQLEDLLKQQNLNNILDKTPVMELTSENFNQEMANNDLLLVDFWAEWCGPCKSMHPIFTRMAKKYKRVRFARVNVDNAQDIAMKIWSSINSDIHNVQKWRNCKYNGRSGRRTRNTHDL